MGRPDDRLSPPGNAVARRFQGGSVGPSQQRHENHDAFPNLTNRATCDIIAIIIDGIPAAPVIGPARAGWQKGRRLR